MPVCRYEIPVFNQTRYNNAIMRQVAKIFGLTLLTLLLITLTSPLSAAAQAGSASDLINGVNALRKSQGLAPYTVDGFLMQFAQTQSDYMASLGTWTHTRSDGSTAFDYGIKENVAMGTNMSVDHCIYTVWSDWVHWETMVGYGSGQVGAGVTIKNGIVYYTLNVLPGGSSYNEPETSSEEDNTSSISGQEQPIVFSQLVTSTPDADGIIIHTVQYGETLWSIAQAYGVPIDQILRNSGLAPGTTQVFEDQTLLIQAATQPSPTPSSTPTEDPGTPTPTQPRHTRTPFPTRTPAPTQTPTQPPSAILQAIGDGQNVGIGLILVSGLGLILVIYLGFLKKG